MRGGFVHNRVLIAPVEAVLRELGASVRRESPVAVSSRYTGFVDILAICGKNRIVCEAELSADRVGLDLAKAAALKATLLLIIVPNRQVGQAVERQVARMNTSPVTVCCLTVGAAVQRLRNKSLLMSAVNVGETLRHHTEQHTTSAFITAPDYGGNKPCESTGTTSSP